MKFELKDGLTVGMGDDKVTHTEIEVKKITTALLFEAREAAEKPVRTPEGYDLIISPTRLELEIIRRRIKRIGDIQGPIQEKEFKSLSEADINLIAEKVNELDDAEGMDTAGRLGEEPTGD